MSDRTSRSADDKELVEAVKAQLAKADAPLSADNRDSAARYIVQNMKERLAAEDLERHIPLDVIELMERGLMSTPLAPEYELHRLVCGKCKKNYAYAIGHKGDVARIKQADEGMWETLRRESGLYKNRLLGALKRSHRVCVVSGEIIEDVFDDEACDAIREFADSGNEFSMLAGPMIENRRDGCGGNRFFDIARADDTHRIKFFVTDRRQDLHFAYSDTMGFIYLEAPHTSAVGSREYLFPELLEGSAYRSSLYEHYVRERFDMAFASPDVRLCRSEEDVLFRDGDKLESTGVKADETGLNQFGRFGLEALIALEEA